MKKIYSFLTSLPFMSFILLALIISMSIATFIESIYGTSVSKAIIYNSKWFEILWLLFVLNLLRNFIRFRLYTIQRFTTGIFHISFVVILLGAVVTRYIGYEGIMHIREGESTDKIISTDNYFYAEYNGEQIIKKVLFSEFTPRQFSGKFTSNRQNIKVRSIGFIENAQKEPIPSESGKPLIDFVFSFPDMQGMQSYMLEESDWIDFSYFSASFGENSGADIVFINDGSELYMISSSEVEETVMEADSGNLIYEPGDTIAVKEMFLYRIGNIQFLIRKFYERATYTAIKRLQGETNEDAVIVRISDGLNEKTVTVFGHSRLIGDTINVEFANSILKLSYGSVPIITPFSIYLKDFQLDRYPGSESPSSFASEVVLTDHEMNLKNDIRIFMNNTLKHRGYKFFQSSYDSDEKGTVLSINHDQWGTRITYLGYILLIAGIILSMMNKNSYFHSVIRRLKQSRLTVILFVLLFGFSVTAKSQSRGVESGLPSVNNEIVKEFGSIWVQGPDGRMEPVSTLAGEVIRKLSKKSQLYGKSPEEAMLSIMAWPEIWRSLPIVKVSNKTIASQLGIAGTYISIENMFGEQGEYKIIEGVQAAYDKTPVFRNNLDKEYIYLDERVNIFFMVYNGSLLNVFPSIRTEDPWYPPGLEINEYAGGDSLFIRNGFQLFVQYLVEQKDEESLQILQAVKNFQNSQGGTLLPSENKKHIEIIYNKVNVFKRIFILYLSAGFILLFILFLNIFRQKRITSILKYFFYGIIVLVFIAHTIGLLARWYISGHAPWSNGYESIVYVAWAGMLAGLIFGRKYPMVIGTSALLSGIALFVAHLSWMNPEITNLVPVLKSYWLTIHVAIITASYGFLGLSAFLGILVLIFISIRTDKNKSKVSVFIDQLTSINELSAMVGLYFLTIGTFLGGIWANESWGRYWGWDPKETWALITIVIYSFIAHMRLIPSLKGIYNYNMASVIGFASVLMTYFGVNYYLSGLHSYGKGIADGIHWAVPIIFVFLAGLIVFAWIQNNKFEKSSVE